jgi:TatD DNase family protein
LREAAAFVPADRLLIETDAPYLAPVPHRGKRNEPAFVARILDAVADIRRVPAGELAAQLVSNFDALMRPTVSQ